ncbi:MAG: Rpn family recombination-promoting nuclease/putative transposase [Treponema sp.]|nr:Rpn family recombination-promoting nuclease/putative transposase [Treponema sp.]
MKLLSPTNDFVFKRIFGDRRNTAILAAFLKAALGLPDTELERLTIVDPHLKRESLIDKTGILDVKVHTASGIVINVEIQVVTSPELHKRFVFYPAKMLTEQAVRGKSYNAIERVISIIIMDGILLPEDVDYYNEYGILNKKTGTAFSDLLTIAVLELPKLPEEPDGRGIWPWGRFFRSRSEEELKMAAERDAGVGQAMAELMELSEDECERLLAVSREKFLWDQWGREKHQYSMGLEEGRRETAKRLKAMGLPIDQIAAAAGLSLEAVKAL